MLSVRNSQFVLSCGYRLEQVLNESPDESMDAQVHHSTRVEEESSRMYPEEKPE